MAFAQLYDSFPLKIILVPREFAVSLDDEFWEKSLKADKNNCNVREYIRNRSSVGITKPTIEWLASAGLIPHERYTDSFNHSVFLTTKGLESVESNKERGNKLLKAAKDLTQDALKSETKKQLKNYFRK